MNGNRLTPKDGVNIYFRAIVLLVAFQLVAGVFLFVVSIFVKNEQTINIINFLMMGVLELCNILAVVFTLKTTKRKLTFGFKPIKWYVALLSFLASAVCIACFVLPAQWFGFLLEKMGFQMVSSFETGSFIESIVLLVIVVFVAPICEELVYRGALFGGLLKQKGVLTSALISGICFALMHMNPVQTVYQFFLGTVACLLAYATRSVLSAIILHAGNNLFALIMEEITMPEFPIVNTPSIKLLIITIEMFIVGVSLIYLIFKICSSSAKGNGGYRAELLKEYQTEEKSSVKLYMIASLIICIVMWIFVLVSGIFTFEIS